MEDPTGTADKEELAAEPDTPVQSAMKLSDNNNNQEAGAGWVVAPVVGAGLGWFATRHLAAGTLLLTEPCTLVLTHPALLKESVVRGGLCGWSALLLGWLELFCTSVTMLFLLWVGWSATALCLLCLAALRLPALLSRTRCLLAAHKLSRLVASLPAHARTAYFQLSSAWVGLGELGIFCTNSFQLADTTSGLFLRAARLNHSCRANCDYRLEAGGPGGWQLQVRTARPVRSGRQLTIAYSGPASYVESRRQHLF